MKRRDRHEGATSWPSLYPSPSVPEVGVKALPRDPRAHRRLSDELTRLRQDEDYAPPCVGPEAEAWTLDVWPDDLDADPYAGPNVELLALAALTCLGCKALSTCRPVGETEPVGVYGGVLPARKGRPREDMADPAARRRVETGLALAADPQRSTAVRDARRRREAHRRQRQAAARAAGATG